MYVASCKTSFLTEVKVPNLMIEKIKHKYKEGLSIKLKQRNKQQSLKIKLPTSHGKQM